MTEREQEANEKLQEIAKDIKSKLPENMGFALLAYEFGENKDGERRMLYVSNSNRSDVILAMSEFINKQLDDPEIFGKHI